MQLHRNQLGQLSAAITKALVENKDIDVTVQREVAYDVEAVLSNYLNQEQDVIQRARDLVQRRGLPQSEFGRVKARVAEEAGIQVGEDALDYVLDQLLEMLMHSNNVEEVYAEDHVLRRRMRTFIRAGDEENKN